MFKSWSRRKRRCVIIASIVISVVLSIVISFFTWLDHTIGEPFRIRDQMHTSIESLATKCPPNMTEEQWETAVFWTNNLPGNCFLPGWADLDDMRRFQRELEERTKGKVDMDLILWIWDEVAKISPAGPDYKQKFQQVMLDEMQLREPDRIASEINKTIGSIATKCPPDMTKEQWEVAVRWTGTLPRSCLSQWVILDSSNRFERDRFHRDLDDLRRFQRELEERVKGKVDMKLIFWIWDEVAKLTPAKLRHKKDDLKMRMLEEMQASPAQRHDWGGGSIIGEGNTRREEAQK